MPNKDITKMKIALIAHDHKKDDLVEWIKYNSGTLRGHELYAIGTTGKLIEKELNIHVNKMQSGPLGGDLQIGAMISEGKIDLLIFFWDPLGSPTPRSRYQGAAENSRRMEYTGCLQPNVGGLYYIIALNDRRL